MINNRLVDIVLRGEADCLWSYIVRATGQEYKITAPVFELEGAERPVVVTSFQPSRAPVRQPSGCLEYACEGPLADDPDLSLEIVFRVPDDSPVVRFRCALKSRSTRRLTRTTGRDRLTYLGTSLASLPSVKEVRFSEFSELTHSFCLSEVPVEARHFENELQVMGPALVAADGTHTSLLAYEHGSQVPDAFLTFDLAADRTVRLRAAKGNYCDGQVVDPESPFASIWFQFAAIPGGETALAEAYRAFVLRHLSDNAESRKPYIFYNTWNFQERNRWWYGNRYLDSMHQERILQEIDIAHRMGIEVFVLDTGWYEKTGDWRVNTERFPDGLKAVKARLDGYGMKLGLWFDPLAAAVSSRMLQEHRDCLMERGGKVNEPRPIWETEESHRLCLVSRYGDAFADELIRLVNEVGVTYFKWDAIGQYGCDAPGHGHGTEANTPQERADAYAFQLGLAMSRVVDKLCAACPEAIVDFDITEGGRYVGLGFLSAGKYFLINNGPYSMNYDLPVPADGNVNLFFFPGPARAWICRTPLTYDRWIPSVLFLTHYLPDDVYTVHDWSGGREVNDAANQWISLASLVLGQNGIWGDLPRVSEEGVARFGTTLALYKQVRDDITDSYPVRTGAVGGSPEVHEKISAATGRGVVCVFATARGSYTYVTANRVAESLWHNDGVSVARDGAGRARIDITFERAGAKIIFFGAEDGRDP